MIVTKEQKQKYNSLVHEEMANRGFTPDEIPMVIAKTGFETVMDKYPEEQMHYSASDAVDEILLVAAKSN